MTHLSADVLRRQLDEPDALSSAEKEHVLACRRCRALRDDLAANAAFAHSALSEPPVQVDLERARLAVASRARALPPAAPLRPAWAPAARWTAGVAAAAALALAIFFAPVRSVAENFLAIFEPHNFQPIAVTSADMEALRAFPDLSAFGTMQAPSGGAGPQMLTFANALDASRAARMNVARPRYLPPQIAQGVEYHVLAPHTAAFTFSAAKARAAAARSGAPLPAMPGGLDGSTLYLAMGVTVTAVYGEPAGRPPARGGLAGVHARLHHMFFGMHGHGSTNMVTVVQAPAPRVYSTGASVREIVDYLLAQPGVSPSLAAQIRAIGDPSTTLPIPIPINRAVAQQVPVQGVTGLAIGDETGVGGGVMWQRGGMVYAVVGPLRESELLTVANSLSP